MELATTRFGTIEIDDSRVVSFKKGLPGFPEAKRFVLLEHSKDSPFYWLQSLEDRDLAFVVMDPLLIDSDYCDAIPPRELKEIGLEDTGGAAILTIVTIDRTEGRVTTNLLGPLVIHPDTGRGKQLILEARRYTTKHDVIRSLRGV